LEFIPGIAAYFNVSTDMLLCVESRTIKETEEQCIYQWKQAYTSGEHQKALISVDFWFS
jgi:hypothetical protein